MNSCTPFALTYPVFLESFCCAAVNMHTCAHVCIYLHTDSYNTVMYTHVYVQMHTCVCTYTHIFLFFCWIIWELSSNETSLFTNTQGIFSRNKISFLHCQMKCSWYSYLFHSNLNNCCNGTTDGHFIYGPGYTHVTLCISTHKRCINIIWLGSIAKATKL